jgi:hypothetical protein
MKTTFFAMSIALLSLFPSCKKDYGAVSEKITVDKTKVETLKRQFFDEVQKNESFAVTKQKLIGSPEWDSIYPSHGYSISFP